MKTFPYQPFPLGPSTKVVKYQSHCHFLKELPHVKGTDMNTDNFTTRK